MLIGAINHSHLAGLWHGFHHMNRWDTELRIIQKNRNSLVTVAYVDVWDMLKCYGIVMICHDFSSGSWKWAVQSVDAWEWEVYIYTYHLHLGGRLRNGDGLCPPLKPLVIPWKTMEKPHNSGCHSRPSPRSGWNISFAKLDTSWNKMKSIEKPFGDDSSKYTLNLLLPHPHHFRLVRKTFTGPVCSHHTPQFLQDPQVWRNLSMDWFTITNSDTFSLENASF